MDDGRLRIWAWDFVPLSRPLGARSRHPMMNSVAPVWDGNETWLVLAVPGCLRHFLWFTPYCLPALYIGSVPDAWPGLFFEAFAFEFRLRARAPLFCGIGVLPVALTLAAFAQGVVVGSYIQGYETANRVLRRWRDGRF